MIEIEEVDTDALSYTELQHAFHDLWHDYHLLYGDLLVRLRAIETTPPPQAVQPIIHVNIDTGAISQAFILGMKHLIEEQTKALIDGLSYAQNSYAHITNITNTNIEGDVSDVRTGATGRKHTNRKQNVSAKNVSAHMLKLILGKKQQPI